ncbi:hypothetical protein [Labilibacter marinus]|uniref:hypothetical protein n=1 Tax=Labilibacter marinus TaxID=1477105 RepID=UPI00082F1BA6|nr:hypothetical protein [Labilibacter marinus]
MQKYCAHLKRKQAFKLWQNGNHAEIIYSNSFFYQKLDYIHNNPVLDMTVAEPEDYIYSSARNYAQLPYLIDIIKETQGWVTI